MRMILIRDTVPERRHTASCSPPKEKQMNEFFTPAGQRLQLSTHSAGHSNALVENPFDEVEATEGD